MPCGTACPYQSPSTSHHPNAAGLARTAQFGTSIEAVYRLIDHLGFVQLDTNYVVERAHHHVMAARIPDYRKEWLADLCAEGRIFEYFSSDAGYHPMRDFRFTLPVKESFAVNGKAATPAESRLMREVMDRAEREGRLMVGNFENDRPAASTGWWDWRPAKIALERLYLEGKLMISRTPAFQKVYGLPLDLVPEDADITMNDLKRFLDAQQRDYATALTEIKAGRKRSHWMWYIFPQIAGLGYSEMAQRYGIKDRDEAIDYLAHPILGKRLIEIASALLTNSSSNATQVMGTPDDMKLRSSMTLFALLPGTDPVFEAVLKKYFQGEKDKATLQLL